MVEDVRDLLVGEPASGAPEGGGDVGAVEDRDPVWACVMVMSGMSVPVRMTSADCMLTWKPQAVVSRRVARSASYRELRR